MVRPDRDRKKYDLILLILSPIAAVAISLLLRPVFLLATFLFFGLPALYLSYRAPRIIPRGLLFAFPFALLGGLFFDHLAVLDNSWHVPATIFSFRVFNTVPLEDLIFAFLVVYLIVLFYEHFLDKGKNALVDKRMRYFAYLIIPAFTIFLLLLFTNSNWLQIDYFYLKGGLALILVPTVAFLLRFPNLVSKFLKTAPYFFYLGLLQELTALQLGHWYFPGKNFIGWVTVLGHRFPYEELIFWLMLFAICVLSWFEFFNDDRV